MAIRTKFGSEWYLTTKQRHFRSELRWRLLKPPCSKIWKTLIVENTKLHRCQIPFSYLSILSLPSPSQGFQGSLDSFFLHFLVKEVFSPFPPAWATFVPSNFHYHIVNPRIFAQILTNCMGLYLYYSLIITLTSYLGATLPFIIWNEYLFSLKNS